MNFSDLKPDDVLASIAPSMRDALVQFNRDNAAVDEVGRVLAGGQYAGVTLKGGGRFPGDLWESAKKEFAELLCDEGGKYDDLRKRFVKITKENQTLFLAQTSAVIGGMLGVQAGLLTPIILWLVLVTLRLGKESCCAVLRPRLT